MGEVEGRSYLTGVREEEWAFAVPYLLLSQEGSRSRRHSLLEADSSLGSGRVTRVLDRLIAEHGRPEAVCSDNGPEFCSRRMLGWAEERKVELIHIQPGRPMQNGHVESFRVRLHDERFNANWFRTFDHVRSIIETWRIKYNEENHTPRWTTAPHGSSGER